MKKENIDKLIREALAIEIETAKEAGSIGYMARALVQATLPHKKTNGNEFERKNGLFKLTILSSLKIGLPYGSIPRLLIAWLTTEAVRTKQKEIILGNTLSKFMEELDLMPTGGRWGTITRLQEQMKRLFSSSISCTYDDGEYWAIKNVQPITKASLWWDPKNPNQSSFFESSVILGDEFFDESTNNPVPIDMRTLKALKKSPLAIDIYCWLTYRLSYLNKKTSIPWWALEVQFGSKYGRTRDFKKKFINQLKSVVLFYPEAKIESNEKSLTLKPSKPHIPLLI